MGPRLRKGQRDTFRESIILHVGSKKIRLGACSGATLQENRRSDAPRPAGGRVGRGNLPEGLRVSPMELLEHGKGATLNAGSASGYVAHTESSSSLRRREHVSTPEFYSGHVVHRLKLQLARNTNSNPHVAGSQLSFIYSHPVAVRVRNSKQQYANTGAP